MAETAKKTIDQILDEMRKVPESITRKKETSTNWHEKFYNAFYAASGRRP